ncbi:hypothetical protein D3C84_757410 [compost metagenome]
MTVVLLLDHRPRVNQLVKVGLEQDVGDLEAENLDPASGRTRATADKAQIKEQHQREIAPQAVVPQCKAGRGHDRRHVQRHMPQRIQPMHLGGPPVPGAEHQPGHQQHAEQALHLLVLEQRLTVATQRRDIQGERQGAENHDDDRHPMHRWLRPLGQGLVRGGETAGGNRRHRVVDRIERAHPGPPERQAAENGDADVGCYDQTRHHVRTGHDFFGTVRRLGLKQPHATDTQQRQNRDGHADKADATDPVQQRAPHQDAGGHVIEVVEYR